MRKISNLIFVPAVIWFAGCSPDNRGFEYYSLLEHEPPFVLDEGKDYDLYGVFQTESGHYYIADREGGVRFQIEGSPTVLEPCLEYASGIEGPVTISIFGRYSDSNTISSIEEIVVYEDGGWAARCSIHEYEPLE